MDRAEPYTEANAKFDDFEVDFVHRRLYRGGSLVPLYSKGFDLLAVLIGRKGEVVAKDELMEAVWPDQFVEEANLTVQISALRKALGEDRRAPKYLVTIPGKGYRFAGAVAPSANEIIIERSSTLVLSSETEIETLDAAAGRTSVRPQLRRRTFAAAALTVVISSVLLIAVGSFVYRSFSAAPTLGTFKPKRFTQITNTGDVTAVTVSPDGNYVAFVRSTDNGNGLSLQQIGNARVVEILPATTGEFWGLTFSPDGKFVYYNLFFKDRSELALYRVRALGGTPETLANNVTGAVSFSPDGRSIAFIQPDAKHDQNYLMVADADGKNPRTIAKKPQPETFIFEGKSTSWSPDGRSIACIINRFEPGTNYSSVVAIDVDSGSETPIGRERWHEISRIEWLKNGSSLLIAGKRERSDARQIWYLQTPDSEVVRVTNDLNDYSSVEAAATGRMLVAVQSDSEHKLLVGDTALAAGGLVELVSETNELHPIEWVDEKKILYRSNKDGKANLWAVRPDGTERRQLTVDAEVDLRGFCVTSDRSHIVFTSWRNGLSNIWRVRFDGSEYIQLTDGAADAFPQCSTSEHQVFFQRGIFSKPEIWQVPAAGGAAEKVVDSRGKWPSLLSGGAGFSYVHLTDDSWMINVKRPDAGSSDRSFPVPENFEGHRVRWSEDNATMYYIGADGAAGNVWSRDIKTGATTKITDLKGQRLSDFAFSPDRKRLAVVRSIVTSDVIMIESDGR